MKSNVVLVATLAASVAWSATAQAQALVTADSITPSSGSGGEQTFVLHYTDSAGAADLGAWVWFHDPMAPATAPSCLIAYTAATNTLNLLDDTGTAWSQGVLGTGRDIENSQCDIPLYPSSARLDGATLTLTLFISFTQPFNGAKTVDMYAASSTGATSGWVARGSWIVDRCTPFLARPLALMSAAAGDSSVSDTLDPRCGSGVSGGAAWITTSTSPYNLQFSVAANAGAAARRALLTIEGVPFWVIQRGTAAPIRGDFDGDGHVDLLWRAPTWNLGLWLMNGASVDLAFDMRLSFGLWSQVGAADFDHDGNVDLLVQAPTGQLDAWLLQGGTVQYNQTQYGPTPLLTQPTDWKVVATADLNHDGWTDIVWQSPGGAVGVWLMHGTAVVGTQAIYSGSSVWRVMAVDDFDRDGNPDLVWQSPAGAVVIWHLDAAGALRSAETVMAGTTDWKIVSTGDIDHDGWPDLIMQASSGPVAVTYLQDTTIRSTQMIYSGLTEWRVVGPK